MQKRIREQGYKTRSLDGVPGRFRLRLCRFSSTFFYFLFFLSLGEISKITVDRSNGRGISESSRVKSRDYSSDTLSVNFLFFFFF